MPKPKRKIERLPLSRDVLIAVAGDIIASEGHEALSLRNLAAQLNVTAAALYAYVDDKLDLLRGVAAREFERLVQRYEAVDGEEPIERLAKIAAAADMAIDEFRSRYAYLVEQDAFKPRD